MIEHIFIDEKGMPPTKARALARVLIVSMILCILLWVALEEFAKASRLEGYQHAAGTIVSSELTTDTESVHREAPYGVTYKAKFAYGGRTRTGTTNSFGTLTSD